MMIRSGRRIIKVAVVSTWLLAVSDRFSAINALQLVPSSSLSPRCSTGSSSSSSARTTCTSSRRGWFTQQAAAWVAVTAISCSPENVVAAVVVGGSSSSSAPDLTFMEAPASGLKYADAKMGTGDPITTKGSSVTIDYVMSTTGARYGAKIYSTQDTNQPYRFRLGDGTTIPGLELAIAGTDGVEAMRPGGIRRVIIPSALAYSSLAQPLEGLQYQDCQEGKGLGPIPPKGEGNVAEYYQRFKNIYCNANRPYQPDLVMDIKLYGKR